MEPHLDDYIVKCPSGETRLYRQVARLVYIAKWRDSFISPSGETRLHFLPQRREKMIVLPLSSQRQSTVHRTVEFRFSSLTP